MPHLHDTSWPAQSEREIADDISAQCNDGYKILRDPIQRGQYLVRKYAVLFLGLSYWRSPQLQMSGQDPLSEAASTGVDPALLMHIMEVREEISSAKGKAALVSVAESNNLELQSSLDDLAAAFASDDKTKAASLLVRLQYIRKVAEEVHAEAERQGVALPEHL